MFPRAPYVPGIYRFTITGGPKDAVYIGETRRVKGLKGRFASYAGRGRGPLIPLKPGNETTRISQWMLRDLRAGMTVHIDYMDDCALASDVLRKDLEERLIRDLDDTVVEVLNLRHR